jgi:hypothetical protein
MLGKYYSLKYNPELIWRDSSIHSIIIPKHLYDQKIAKVGSSWVGLGFWVGFCWSLVVSSTSRLCSTRREKNPRLWLWHEVRGRRPQSLYCMPCSRSVWSQSTFVISSRTWFMTLVNNVKSSVVYILTLYTTSTFAGQSLLITINIVAFAITAAVFIPKAKALDLCGCAEGLLLMNGFGILGINSPVSCVVWSACLLCWRIRMPTDSSIITATSLTEA